MKKGSFGMNVKAYQRNMVQLGFGKYLGEAGVDGVFGKDTVTTTKKFQSWAKIEVDGEVGNETQGAITYRKKVAGTKGTYNFDIREFYCKGSNTLIEGGMDNDLMLKLEQLRYELGNHPVMVTSGYRSVSHNKVVGGAKNSQHLYGKASDIKVHGVSPKKVYNEANKLFTSGGVGRYATFTHVDTRGKRVRF